MACVLALFSSHQDGPYSVYIEAYLMTMLSARAYSHNYCTKRACYSHTSARDRVLELTVSVLSGVPLLECYSVHDTSPENTIVGLPPGWVDTDVCRLYISINPTQSGSRWAPSMSPPVSWWTDRCTLTAGWWADSAQLQIAYLFMAALCNPYVIGQAIIFLPCGFFYLSSVFFF